MLFGRYLFSIAGGFCVERGPHSSLSSRRGLDPAIRVVDVFDDGDSKLQLRPALYVLTLVVALALVGVHFVSIGVLLLIVALVLLRNWMAAVGRWMGR